jgi:hypothetical protein
MLPPRPAVLAEDRTRLMGHDIPARHTAAHCTDAHSWSHFMPLQQCKPLRAANARKERRELRVPLENDVIKFALTGRAVCA